MKHESIKGLVNSDFAVAGLYVGLIGAILGEILPTPSDPIDFYLERKWRVQLEQGEITPEQYWKRIAAKYYLLDATWWTIVFGTALLVKGDFKRKAMIVGAVIGAGAAVGVLGQNIKKDIEYFATK